MTSDSVQTRAKLSGCGAQMIRRLRCWAGVPSTPAATDSSAASRKRSTGSPSPPTCRTIGRVPTVSNAALPELVISGRRIGLNFRPLVIAEIGINHEGRLATALEMVDAAALAGVEIVKHQTHVVEDEMSPAARAVKPGNA